ncbi:MAG: hypothetical protein PHN84_09505 [Desulfuromonadaceae bacterium]|nr:hypothetical protein [Desulfuromonadaceae bacterium]MDD2856775.1 hypothetical protein [Desulfuromonadaceae bacterium]
MSRITTNCKKLLELEVSTIDRTGQTGRPAGDEAFVDKVADATGRDLSKGKAGRPKKQ